MCDSRIVINFENNFYSKNMNMLCEFIGKDKIEKIASSIELTVDNFKSLSFMNFSQMSEARNEMVYTGYLSFELFHSEYEKFIEYTIISHFNQIRSKAFVSYSQFNQIWDTAQTASSSLKDKSDKVKLILISGIPGSGKSTLGVYLSKLLNIEEIHTSTYVVPVNQSTKFSSEDFLKGLYNHCSVYQTPTVIGVIPSYHHLKKAIFEFK